MALTDGLVNLWEFEEGPVTHPDLAGSIPLTDFIGTDTASTTAGKVGNALNTGGSLTSVWGAGELDFFASAAFSFSYWLNPFAVGTLARLFDFSGGAFTSPSNFVLQNADASVSHHVRFTSFGVVNVTSAPSSISALAWTLCTVTWGFGNLVRLYLNAAEVDSTTVGSNTPSAAPGSPRVNVGANAEGGDGSNALIDQVAWWDRELTPTEVTELYNSGDGVTLISSGGGGGGLMPLTRRRRR